MERMILAIDDETMNLDVIEGFLEIGENTSHTLIKSSNGEEGYQELVKHFNEIDLILLDRMMPVMSGMDFLKKIKADNRFNQIPIIMQTASNTKEHMEEGYELGINHYLVKPFTHGVFNAMVKSAIDFNSKRQNLIKEIQHSKTFLTYVEKADFRIKNLEDVDLISISLARLFPDPGRIILGISEMLTNAIEHGNIGITYDEKTQLNLAGTWKTEVQRRLALPENQEKYIKVSYIRTGNEIILNIVDQGQGFEFNKYLDFDPARSTDSHGRGIAYANNLSFDALEFLKSGNEVNCKVILQ